MARQHEHQCYRSTSRIDWAWHCIDLLKASLLNQEPVSVECNDMEYHIALTVVSVYAVHVGPSQFT